MRYEIVHITFGHPSFSWGNGDYIIIKQEKDDECIEICRIRDGEPDRFDDGNFMCAVTGKNNPGIVKTGKFISVVNKKERKYKLERILK